MGAVTFFKVGGHAGHCQVATPWRCSRGNQQSGDAVLVAVTLRCHGAVCHGCINHVTINQHRGGALLVIVDLPCQRGDAMLTVTIARGTHHGGDFKVNQHGGVALMETTWLQHNGGDNFQRRPASW